jgi:hypothetical protein
VIVVTIWEGRECALARRETLDGSPSRRVRGRADASGADVATAAGSPSSAARERALRLRAAPRRERWRVAPVDLRRGRARGPAAGEVLTWVDVTWVDGVVGASCVAGVASCTAAGDDVAAGDAAADVAAPGAGVAVAGEAVPVAPLPVARESDDLPDVERLVLARVVAPAAPGVVLCVVAGLPPAALVLLLVVVDGEVSVFAFWRSWLSAARWWRTERGCAF